MILDYDDIVLIPRVISSIESRDKSEIDIGVTLSDNIRLKVPIMASPMKDVCDGAVANKIWRLGCFGIIHRFMSTEDQIVEFKKIEPGHYCACALGINGDFYERFQGLYKAGCRSFCLDVANGASIYVKRAVEKISQEHSDIVIIVGNVASKECYKWLDEIKAITAIRVGIAGGKACTTKNATGVACGMISAIIECATVRENTLLIADGGIREPQDVCKAIACGADLVMMGSVIAVSEDSPAETTKVNGQMVKMYHGSASFSIQKHYKEKPKYIEGRTVGLEYTGENLEEIVTRFSDGLISSMSYFDARTIKEYQNNITYEIISR